MKKFISCETEQGELVFLNIDKVYEFVYENTKDDKCRIRIYEDGGKMLRLFKNFESKELYQNFMESVHIGYTL